MRAFVAQHRIDHANWEFLSLPPAIVDALTRDFGFSDVATPAGFDHVVGVTPLNAHGRIHTQVFGDHMDAQRIGEPLRQLLSQAPLPPHVRLADVIERVRTSRARCTTPTLARTATTTRSSLRSWAG